MRPGLFLNYNICIFFFYFFLPISTLSQSAVNYNITYRILSQEDGLASRNVNAGLQDSRGFIWLGTKDGLNRYDGKRFQLFTKEKNKLQSNNVVDICEDVDQKLWILYGRAGVNTISLGKLDLVDINTNTTISFKDYLPNAPFKQDDISGIAVNNFRELFIYVDGGFVYQYLGKKQFRKINQAPTINNEGGHFVFINHATDSGFWLRYDNYVGKDGKMIQAPKFDKGYQVLCFQGETEMLMMHPRPDVFPDYTGIKIIKVSTKGVEEYKEDFPEETKRLFYKICKKDFYIVLRDHKSRNTLVYSGGDGIFLYKDKQLISLVDTNFIKNMPSMGITDFFTDREGQIWLCTSIGAMIIKMSPNRFKHYLNSTSFQIHGNRKDYQTRGIHADTAGNIYISCAAGAFHVKEGIGDKRKVTRLSKSLYNSPMINDGDNYYFGHIDLYEYNKVTGKKRVLFNVEGYDILWNVYKLKSGNWWISNNTDFFWVKDKIFKRFTDKRTGKKISKAWIHQFFEDSKNVVWAVGSKGLFVMDNDSTIRDHYGVEEANPLNKLPFEDIHCVHEDDSGDFWMATNGDGLYKWIRNKHEFLHFTIADGLSSNLLYGVLEDERGYLWISSDNGLMRFNKLDNTVKTYTTRDGITNNEFNRLSYFKAADGQMFFGSIDGVNSFYPHDFWNDNKKFSAPLQVISYNQYNAQTNRLEDRTSGLVTSGKIVLNPGDNFFTIEFSLLDFENGKKRYSYKIEGIDKTWNYIDVNTIRISNLDYGEYTLKIKGQNNEGQWSSSELTIPLQVIAPFYKRTDFIIICIIVVIILTVGYIRFRVWQYKRRNKALEGIVSERTHELRNSLQQKEILLKEIHHRVKNNLQVISSLLQLQSHNVKDEAAKAALIEGHNRVLSISLLHQKLYQNDDLATVDLAAFTNELFTQINEVFSNRDNIAVLSNNLPVITVSIDVATPLGLILNELMTNSFKHGSGNNAGLHIAVGFSQVNDEVVLEYKDNGPGLSQDLDINKSKTLGLRLIVRLCKQLNGRTEYHYNNGAVFKLFIPSDIIQVQNR